MCLQFSVLPSLRPLYWAGPLLPFMKSPGLSCLIERLHLFKQGLVLAQWWCEKSQGLPKIAHAYVMLIYVTCIDFHIIVHLFVIIHVMCRSLTDTGIAYSTWSMFTFDIHLLLLFQVVSSIFKFNYNFSFKEKKNTKKKREKIP